jgi:hypothetical protein
MQIVISYDSASSSGTIQFIFQSREDILAFIDRVLKPTMNRFNVELSVKIVEKPEAEDVERL